METINRKYLERLAWVLFFIIFLLVGAIGHDPWWKRGEAYSFGIIYHFYLTNTWLVPIDAGQPFLEKPPLYYWTAHILCELLKGILPLHDAARLSSVLYLCIAAWFTWKTARTLFEDRKDGKSLSVIACLLFLGTRGVVQLGHAMATDVALLAGVTISLYGMALICTQNNNWKKGGFWLGLGVGIAFMAKGFVIPAVIFISGSLLWLALKKLHTRNTFHAVLMALAVASPFLLIWPYLLYRESPALFMEWFWQNNIGRFLGFSVAKLGAENDRFHLFIEVFPLFTFPVFPLACAQAIAARHTWKGPATLVPLVVAVITLLTLLCSASGRPPYLLPLIPVFALLGAQMLASIPAQVCAYWNSFVRIAFSGAAIIIWLIWWTLMQPIDHRPLAWLVETFCKRLPADFVPEGSPWLACTLAATVALFWIRSLRLNNRTPENTARIWFIGAALIWCTIFTLLSPWLNETRSYRRVLTQVTDFVEHSPYAGSCIGNYKLGENVAPMLQYFTHREVAMPLVDLDSHVCPLILTFAPKDAPTTLGPHWHMVWKGKEFLDLKGMEVRLYASPK